MFWWPQGSKMAKGQRVGQGLGAEGQDKGEGTRWWGGWLCEGGGTGAWVGGALVLSPKVN